MTTAFDRRIGNIPDSWAGPITEVVDTADAIRLALEEWGCMTPELLLGLTQLALARHDTLNPPETLLPSHPPNVHHEPVSGPIQA